MEYLFIARQPGATVILLLHMAVKSCVDSPVVTQFKVCQLVLSSAENRRGRQTCARVSGSSFALLPRQLEDSAACLTQATPPYPCVPVYVPVCRSMSVSKAGLFRNIGIMLLSTHG